MSTDARCVRDIARAARCVVAVCLLLISTVVVRTSGGNAALASEPFTARCPPTDENRLVVAAGWTGVEQEYFAKVLKRFERKHDVDVLYSYETRNIADTLRARIGQGCPPDVALLPQPGLLWDLAREGTLRPIDAVVGPLIDVNYDPVWRELGSFHGVLYGVWFKASNKSVVWYNPEVFARAGVSPPETWAEMLDVAATIRERTGIPPFSVAGADGWTLTDWFENVYLRTYGLRQYERLARHEIAWTDESVKHALRTLSQILGDPDMLAGGTEGALATTYEESVRQVFVLERAAMVYEGDFVATLLSKANVKVGVEAKSFEFPWMDARDVAGPAGGPIVVGAQAIGGDVAALFSKSPLAEDFIRFLATPDAAEPWAKAGGFNSPNRGLPLDVYPNELAVKTAEALRSPENVAFDLTDRQRAEFGATASQGSWRIFQDYLRNPTEIDRITQELEAAAQGPRF